MTSTWKTVRVFISSTFRDMHAERDHLVKVVFPALRERLEKYRVHLIDIDLRWGVTKEQADNDEALDVCLDQIDACRPFFIGILGERYGWVSTRNYTDRITSKYGWIRHHTGKSITELEILYGVLNDPEMHDHAFFSFRDPAFIDDVPPLKRIDMQAEDAASAEKLVRLKQAIRDARLPVVSYSCKYGGLKTNGDVQLTGLDEFGRQIAEWLGPAIKAKLELQEQPTATTETDTLAEEADFHERFMESRLRVYVGREQINDALTDFVERDEPVACLVTGPSGSGKSAALARFVKDYRQRNPQTLVEPYFIGASPTSTSLRHLLRHFCLALQAKFAFADTVTLENGLTQEVPLVIPEETNDLQDMFRLMVTSLPDQARVLLIIDALDQLDKADGADALHWLPEELPAQLKMLLSSVNEPGARLQQTLQQRRWHRVALPPLTDDERLAILREVPSLSAKTLDAEQQRLLMDNPATRNPLFLQVALEELRGFGSFEQLTARIRALPRTGDTVTALFVQVVERLTQDFNRRLALLLLGLLVVARRGLSERELLELVQRSGPADDFYPILRQLRPYLLLRDGLVGFYHQGLQRAVESILFKTLESRHKAHRYLARYFQSHETWAESVDEQRARARSAPPRSRAVNARKADELLWQWTRAAEPEAILEAFTDWQLLEAKVEGGLVYDLVLEFQEAAEALPKDHPGRRLLGLLREAVKTDIHFLVRHPTALFQCLWNSCWWHDAPAAAAHYDRPPEGWRDRPWDRPEPRLHQLLEAWRDAKNEHTPDFLWVRCLRPPFTHLGTAQQAVLRGHADTVSSVAYAPDGQRILSASADQTVRVWDVATGKEQLSVHGSKVDRAVFSPDVKLILGRVGTGAPLAWDAGTGLPRSGGSWPIPPKLEEESHSSDGLLAVTFKKKGTRSGGPDGAIQTEFEPVRVVERATGRELCRLVGHELPVTCAAFAPNGKRIVTGSFDNTVRVWEAGSGRQLRVFHGHLAMVTDVAFSPDGRWLVSAGGTRYGIKDCTIRVWNLMSNAESRRLRSHRYLVTCLAVSADGQRAVSGSQEDDPLKTWDLATGQVLCDRFEHQGWVNGATFSLDGRHIAAASGEDVGIWDAATGKRLFLLRQHAAPRRAPAQRVAYHPDGKVLLSEHRENFVDDMVRVWDVGTGECLELHPGKLDDILGEPALVVWRTRTHDRLETILVDPATGQAAGWFPAELNQAVGHAESPLLLGAANNHVFLLQVEGRRPECFEPVSAEDAAALAETSAATADEQSRRVSNVQAFSGDETAKLIDKMIEGKEITMNFVGDIVSSILSGLDVSKLEHGRIKKDEPE